MSCTFAYCINPYASTIAAPENSEYISFFRLSVFLEKFNMLTYKIAYINGKSIQFVIEKIMSFEFIVEIAEIIRNIAPIHFNVPNSSFVSLFFIFMSINTNEITNGAVHMYALSGIRIIVAAKQNIRVLLSFREMFCFSFIYSPIKTPLILYKSNLLLSNYNISSFSVFN